MTMHMKEEAVGRTASFDIACKLPDFLRVGRQSAVLLAQSGLEPGSEWSLVDPQPLLIIAPRFLCCA